ncbi:hypothetical protein SAMN02745126_04252 [Enhydrobacter aerosaccus]|uniref:Uncharacterized protein n=1 Tax=Enhydrobacter aerosaccus TaxID=225324 RepID=A0A1T4S1F9_9HYPH|nr:hypothetical protein [Enhydrobacter aerosaccus]SKA21768.1 hypothetical protein SAMN02745126_04252 [Enhydrobacter aerosaccus]
MIRLLPLLLGVLGVTAGIACAQSRAHMEACTQWKKESSTIGTRNDCDRPISIKFMAYDGSHRIEADVPAGGWFDTGVPDGTIEGFIFTVCPVGNEPSVRFSLENQKTISDSLYNCLPRDRPGV